MASKISINLDTSKENFILTKCKQDDDLTLEAMIYENGLALDLTNKEIFIKALKADNTYIIQNTNVIKEGNKILAELDRDFSRVRGTTKIEVLLVEGGKNNTTFSFYLEVGASVIEGAVESNNTVTILEELDKKVLEAGQAKVETEQLIKNGNAATKGDIAKVNSSLEENKNRVYDLDDRNSIKTNSLVDCAITFVSDDGVKKDYDLWYKKIFKPLGLPFATCVITGRIGVDSGYCTWEQLEEMRDYGASISSHTHGHRGTNLTIEELEYEFGESKRLLKEHNLDYKTVFTPGGAYDPNIRKVGKKYYDAVVITGYQQNDGADKNNNPSLERSLFDNYKITRMAAMDSSTSRATFEQAKATIDYAVKNKLWLIFVCHSHESYFNTEANIEEFKSLVLYAKNQPNTKVVNMIEGYNLKANKIQIDNNETFLNLTNDGEVITNLYDKWNLSPVAVSTNIDKWFNFANIELQRSYISCSCDIDYKFVDSSSLLSSSVGKIYVTYRSSISSGTFVKLENFSITGGKDYYLNSTDICAVETVENDKKVLKLYFKYSIAQRKLSFNIANFTSVGYSTAKVVSYSLLTETLPEGTVYNCENICGHGYFLPKLSSPKSETVYTTQKGIYCIINNCVHYSIELVGTYETGSTGTIYLSGLPYTSGGNVWGGTISRNSEGIPLHGIAVASKSTSCFLYNNSSGKSVNLDSSAMSGKKFNFLASGSYSLY